MTSKIIHIVSLDVPYPADYGGMIDVFYRIQAFYELGYEVILHCFEYGRGKSDDLLKYCKEVHYYSRKRAVSALFSPTPFIVKTRINKELEKRLSADQFPIWLEGLHCSWYLQSEKLKGRLMIVRTHNIEHDYYVGLAKSTYGNRRIFFKTEALKLKKYEGILKNASAIVAIQDADVKHFKNVNENTYLLPGSLPNVSLTEEVEIGNYCLFHGNLSVPEVHESAIFLLENVIPHLASTPFIIAGKNPSDDLISKAKKLGIQLAINPSMKEMNQLIKNARIHVLPTTQDTGLKLKLLFALQTYGCTVVNDLQLNGNDLGKYCFVANSAEEFKRTILNLYEKPIDWNQRKKEIEEVKAQYGTSAQLALLLQQLKI